jgi:Uma2 family endonuclease
MLEPARVPPEGVSLRLHSGADDGIVVDMETRYDRHRLTVNDYLAGSESLRPTELVFGVLREPPAPFYSHQAIVTRLTAKLYEHVDAHQLGMVCVSPIDVVLDRERALVVQPDIIFISHDRLPIVDRCVWGAPDLVVEVLSTATARRDRTTKVGWYDAYGVRECWLLDPQSDAIEVMQFGPSRRCRRFAREDRVESSVLPQWDALAGSVFG